MSPVYTIGTVLRVGFTIWLLIGAMHHSHWTVALVLCLLFISCELQSLLWRKLAARQ